MMSSQLVIEWTRATVRVALVQGKGPRARLHAIRSMAIGPTHEIATALRSICKQLPRGGKRIIGVIPREQVITRIVKFPATQRDELAQMVSLYVKTQLPYPDDQTVKDFSVIQQEGAFSTVGIIAAQRTTLERHLSVFQAAGMLPALLTVSPWGVLGWWRRFLNTQTLRPFDSRHGLWPWTRSGFRPTGESGGATGSARGAPQAAPTAGLQEPILIVNVDDTRTDLVVCIQGCVLSSRSMSQGVQDWNTMEEATEVLVLEIERSRAALRKELPEREVQSILLTGLIQWPQWQQALSSRCGLSLHVIEGQASLGKVKKLPDVSISPVVITGIAMTEPQELLSLNLTQMDVQARQNRQNRELLIGGILFLGAMGLGTALARHQVYRQQRLVTQLEELAALQTPQARRLQERLRAIDLARSTLGRRSQLARILAGIMSQSTQAIQLEAVTYEREQDTVALRGQTQTTQQVLEYIQKLEGLEDVAEVRMRYSTRRQTQKGERVDFELILRLVT